MAEIFVDVKPEHEWRPGMTREKIIDEMDRALGHPQHRPRLLAADPRQRARIDLADQGPDRDQAGR
jgi:hypothetical protein